MQKQTFHLILVCLLTLLCLSQCQLNESTGEKTLKFAENDPFKESMTASQTFTISGKSDNVVQGNAGTLLVIPEGSFTNDHGEIVTDKIKIELTEAFALEDMLLSNLTTTSDGKLLETDGMIYLNATSGDDQLYIDPKHPIYIEIPTERKIPGMMAYRGTRDANGNMNWSDPKELEKFLVTVEMKLLDFYPQGFRSAVQRGLPFKSHQVADEALLDSLFYSLSVQDVAKLKVEVLPELNEPYNNERKRVSNGKYTDESYYYDEQTQTDQLINETTDTTAPTACGVDPAIIKAIRSEKFQNTLISTREFETRLQSIFQTCRDDILEIYIKNLDKDLWELDSIAAASLTGNDFQEDFKNYSEQRLTNVEEGGKHTDLLREYYKQELTAIKAELKKAQKKVVKALQAKNKIAKKVVNDYKNLLFKREKYRMEKYGFNWSSTGWINIDVGTEPKDWGPQPLQILVEGSDKYDRVYTYVVYRSLKSLYRLNSNDSKLFYVGNAQRKEMLMPKKKSAVALTIAYSNHASFFGQKIFETGTDTEFKMVLEKSSQEEIRSAISAYDDYAQENRIDKDLEFMAFFAQEKQRRDQLRKENEFVNSLKYVVFPCCNRVPEGEQLYINNCQPCHEIFMKAIGPALNRSTEKHSMEWLIAWTKNSSQLISAGDPQAKKIFAEYNGSVQPSFDLTNKEIVAIFKYIDGQEMAIDE